MAHSPKAISGRWFTIAFAIILAVGVVGGFLLVVRFQHIMGALDQVRERWPDAAVALEEHYLQIDERLDAEPSHVAAWDPSDRAAWVRARSDFHASTLFDEQQTSVPVLESIAQRVQDTTNPSAVRRAVSARLREFLEADRALDALQSDWLGRACMQIFRLRIPPRIYRDIRVS